MGQALTAEERKKFQQRYLSPEPGPLPPAARQAGKQPAFLDEIIKGSARGVVTGPSSVLDLIGMGAEAGLKQAGLPEEFEAPSATRGAESLGLPTVSTAAGRIAEGVTGGGVLTPFAPVIGGTVGGISAAAMEIARKFTDDPVITAGVGLLGGLSAGGIGRSVKAGAKIVGSLQPTIRRRILQGQMERMTAAAIPNMDATMAAAQEATALSQAIPGFKPALADIVPSLQQASRHLRRVDADVSVAQNARVTGNLEAAVDKAEQMAKRLPSGTAESAAHAVKHREAVQRQVQEARTQKAHTDFDDAIKPIREEVGDLPDTAGFGQGLRTEVQNAFEAEKAAFKPRYDALDLNLKTDPAPSIDALRKIEAGVKKAEVPDLPDSFTRDVIRNLGRQKIPGVKGGLGPRGDEPLSEIRAVRSSLLSERMAERAKASPNKNKVRLISELLEGVEKNIEGAISTSQNNALKQLNAEYRDFKLRYDAKPIDAVLDVSRGGGPGKSNIDLFNQFTSTTGGKNIEHFKALQGAVGDAKARELYSQAIMSKFIMTTRKADGTFDPKAVGKFTKDHEAVIKELPTIQNQFSRIQATADAVVKIPTKPPTLADFDNTYTRALMGDDPENAITRLVKGGNMRTGLKAMTAAFGSEPAAFRAISRPMWKALFEKAGLQTPSDVTFAKLGEERLGSLIHQNRAALRGFYGDEAYEGLVEIQKSARLAKASPSRVDFEMSPEKSNFSGFVKTLWSRAFGIARGVIGAPFTSAEVFTRRAANLIDAFDEKEIRIIMDNILHDPDLITILTKAKTIRQTLETQRGLKRWLRLNVVPAAGVVAQDVVTVATPLAQNIIREPTTPSPERPRPPE